MQDAKIYQKYITDFSSHYSLTKQEGYELLSETGKELLLISLINYVRPCTTTKTIKIRFDYLKKAGLSFDQELAELLDSNISSIVEKFKI